MVLRVWRKAQGFVPAAEVEEEMGSVIVRMAKMQLMTEE